MAENGRGFHEREQEKNKRVVIEKRPIKYLHVTSLALEILLPMSESFFAACFTKLYLLRFGKLF